MPTLYNKKLIEVALPLEAINAQSSREKSIRHGHPSTLHLYWARRPLAAARAVIWASLVDDPSSRPDLFPTEEAQEKERRRLFAILERLVKWENSNNEQVLAEAKAEIKRSMGDALPSFLDPFAGGGAIPLEAQRLGLEAHAHDLNPVPVIINKAMIELPPRFAGMPAVNPESQILAGVAGKGAAGLAEDVRYYGEWMRDEAFKRIGKLYPKIKDEEGIERTVIAWIWARTVKCPNPACGIEAPLARSFVLTKKKGKTAWAKPSFEGGKLSFDVRNSGEPELEGTVNRGGAVCAKCGAVIAFDHIRAEGKAGRLGAKLMTIVAEGDNERLYFSPNDEHIKAALCEPPEDVPESNLPEKALSFRVQAYGMTRHRDLFTNRQLTMLTTFSDLVGEAQKQAEEDALKRGMANDGVPLRDGGRGAKAYGEAVAVYLAFVVDRLAGFCTALCLWDMGAQCPRQLFSRQAIPMTWDYAEGNPFSESSGSWEVLLHNFLASFSGDLFAFSRDIEGCAAQFDAQADCGLRGLMVSTDPPYYDNIGYADLSDFFYVWLRRSLKNIYPDLFRTMLTPKTEELIATPFRFGGSKEKAKEFFESGMAQALVSIHDEVREDVPATIYYAYKQSDDDSEGIASTGWETMLSSIIRAGFTITGTWPMRTEMVAALKAKVNALASSVVIVCRKRAADAGVLPSREFSRALKRELAPALKELEKAGIAPVDMAQAAIGPGIAVFSRYDAVMDADGTAIPVRTALQQINKELDEYFSGQDGSMDEDSRFCAALFLQLGYNPIKYGQAEVLEKAKGASIKRLKEIGALCAEKGEVRLYTREELPPAEKAAVERCGAWMLAQLLIRALDKGGWQACAKIYNRAERQAIEAARSLAYRLYSSCEKKGWAAEARAFNSIVAEWMDITRAADEQKRAGQQMNLELS